MLHRSKLCFDAREPRVAKPVNAGAFQYTGASPRLRDAATDSAGVQVRRLQFVFAFCFTVLSRCFLPGPKVQISWRGLLNAHECKTAGLSKHKFRSLLTSRSTVRLPLQTGRVLGSQRDAVQPSVWQGATFLSQRAQLMVRGYFRSPRTSESRANSRATECLM